MMEHFSFNESFSRLRTRCPPAAQSPCVQELDREQVIIVT
jgi:hypothetical protein